MKPPIRCLCLALGLAFAGIAGAVDAPTDVDAPVKPRAQADQNQNRGNICFGGFEHGKLIPPDDEVKNPFRQTTLLGCAIEGGAPTFLPDLKPKVADGVMS